MSFHKLRGFTLIEIIVVTAIVGILSMIAIPNYISSVKKSHRIDAQLTMQKIALAIERYYTTHGTIKGTNKTFDLTEHYGNACIPTVSGCSESNPDIRYFFTLDLESDFYTILATPQNAQADDECGTLSLDMTNTKNIIGAQSNVTLKACW